MFYQCTNKKYGYPKVFKSNYAKNKEWGGCKIYDPQRGINANCTIVFDKDGRLTFVKNHGTETFRAALRWFDGKGVDAAGPSGGVRQEKRLLAYGYGFEADDPVVSQGADCSFEVAKLGPAPIEFAVWPCDCFGNRGKAIS